MPQWLPWSPNEGTVVATVIAQLTLLVGQSRLTCGTREAEAFLRGDQWPTHVHTFCNYGDACAFPLPPLSDLWATEFLGDPCACYCFTFLTCSKLHSDHGVHGEVWTSVVPPLNDQGKLLASFVPSTATWPVLWSHWEAQRSQPPCKGGINHYLTQCWLIVQNILSHTTADEWKCHRYPVTYFMYIPLVGELKISRTSFTNRN